jgi:hypothetical protein
MGSLHPVDVAIHGLPVLATDGCSDRMQKAACEGTGRVLQFLPKQMRSGGGVGRHDRSRFSGVSKWGAVGIRLGAKITLQIPGRAYPR